MQNIFISYCFSWGFETVAERWSCLKVNIRLCHAQVSSTLCYWRWQHLNDVVARLFSLFFTEPIIESRFLFPKYFDKWGVPKSVTFVYKNFALFIFSSWGLINKFELRSKKVRMDRACHISKSFVTLYDWRNLAIADKILTEHNSRLFIGRNRQILSPIQTISFFNVRTLKSRRFFSYKSIRVIYILN